MNTFSNWFNNDLVQSMLISPIMGVFFAALFSGLDRSPSENAPVTVIETINVYKEQIIYYVGETRRSTSDDPITIAIAATFGLMFLAWKYVVYSGPIINYLLVFIFTALSFSVTTILISILKGHFNSKSWWFYIATPFFLLCFCLYLLLSAKDAIGLEIINLARKNNPIDFYTQALTGDGWYFVITQLLGVTALFILALLSTFIELHYLALMNQRGKGIFIWFWVMLTSITWRFSGRNTFITSFILSAFSFLLLKGYVANWMSGKW